MLEAAAYAAAAENMWILLAAGVEFEAELPFSGLHQAILPLQDEFAQLGQTHRDALGMRDASGHNAPQVAEARQYAATHDVDLRSFRLDVSSQHSVDEAVGTVISAQGSIDVLLHNAGHMVTGPTEAFTPEQVAEIYDTNVLGTQRLNRAALPHMRGRRYGLVVWIGSTSTRGGTPPYLGPYFAAKARMDALGVSYAAELPPLGADVADAVVKRRCRSESRGIPDADWVARPPGPACDADCRRVTR